MTPKTHKFIIEITTESSYNLENMYEALAKYVIQFGTSGYLRDKQPICHIKDLRIFKLLPERTQVVDNEMVRKYNRD